jgi:hypothetical protein
MPTTGLWHPVALVRTEVSEEPSWLADSFHSDDEGDTSSRLFVVLISFMTLARIVPEKSQILFHDHSRRRFRNVICFCLQ